MLAFLIVGVWCFIVALACVVGTNKELVHSLCVVSSQRSDIREYAQTSQAARDKTEGLLQYLRNDREYRAFDDVLSKLPIGAYRGNPQVYKLMESSRLPMAALHFNEDPCSIDMSITALEFEALAIHSRGKEYTGWGRNGWVILPREALL